MDWDRKRLVDFNVEKLNLLHLTGLTLVLLMWKWMDLFLRKNHLSRCWSLLSLPDWIGDLTLPLLLKLPSESCILICSMKFLSPNVVLYFSKSTIWPCMDTVAMSGLVFLVATWNCWISRYAELLVLHVLALLSSWLSWFHFLFLKGGLLVILMHYITFLSPFLDVTRMSMLSMTSFDCRFFLKRFCVCFNLFELLFLVTPCLIVAVQHCMAWIPIFLKKLHVKNLKWFWTRKQIIKSLWYHTMKMLSKFFCVSRHNK